MGVISVVHSHHGRSKDNEDEIERILGRAGLTPDVLVPTAGTDEELEAVVQQVLRELGREQDG